MLTGLRETVALGLVKCSIEGWFLAIFKIGLLCWKPSWIGAPQLLADNFKFQLVNTWNDLIKPLDQWICLNFDKIKGACECWIPIRFCNCKFPKKYTCWKAFRLELSYSWLTIPLVRIVFSLCHTFFTRKRSWGTPMDASPHLWMTFLSMFIDCELCGVLVSCYYSCLGLG